MVYILLNWLVVGLTSLVAGKLSVLLLTKLFFKQPQEKINFLYLILTGFASVSFVAGIYHLFLPLSSLFIHIVLAACVLLMPFLFWQSLQWNQKKVSPYRLIVIILLGMTGANLILDIANLSFELPHHYDDGLYYRPFVNWLTQYPVVPGLGNLHFRLASNSSWHLLTAVYDKTIFSTIRFNDLNGFLMALAIIYGFAGLYALVVHRSNTLTNYAGILIVCLLLFREGGTFFTIFNWGVVTSPTPDLPAALFTWYIFLLALHKAEKKTWYIFDLNALLIVILVCFTITIKLSVAPLVLLAFILFFTYAAGKNWHGLAIISIAAVLVVAPWLISNVIMSGYLVFPIYQIDLFNFDWKVTDQMIKYAATNVGSWAKTPGLDQHTAPLSEWVPGWYERLDEFSRYYLWLVVYTHVIYWGLLLVNSAAGRKSFYNSRPFLLIYLVLLTGTLVWFLNIPDFRFGFGFTLLPIILFAAILVKELLYDLRMIIGLGYSIYLLFTMSGGYMSSFLDIRSGFYQQPADEFPVPYKTMTLENHPVFLPEEGDQCWDIPLPCMPAHYGTEGKTTQFRGPAVADGFHVR